MSEKLLVNNQSNRLSQLILFVISISVFIFASCATTGERNESISADSTKQVLITSGSELEIVSDSVVVRPLNTS